MTLAKLGIMLVWTRSTNANVCVALPSSEVIQSIAINERSSITMYCITWAILFRVLICCSQRIPSFHHAFILVWASLSPTYEYSIDQWRGVFLNSWWHCKNCSSPQQDMSMQKYCHFVHVHPWDSTFSQHATRQVNKPSKLNLKTKSLHPLSIHLLFLGSRRHPSRSLSCFLLNLKSSGFYANETSKDIFSPLWRIKFKGIQYRPWFNMLRRIL